MGLLGWVGLATALACRQPVPQGAVQVRIRNETGGALQALTLGPGEGTEGPEDYGRVGAGETTEFRPRRPFLASYRQLRFVTAEGQAQGLTVYPEQHLGMRELPQGRYTFALTRKGARPLLRIIEEPRY